MTTLTASSIILPPKVETGQVRRGRDVGARMEFGIRNLREQGKHPTRVRISRGSADALHAFFDFACASYDGVLPRTLRGVPIVIEPGDEREVLVEATDRASN